MPFNKHATVSSFQIEEEYKKMFVNISKREFAFLCRTNVQKGIIGEKIKKYWKLIDFFYFFDYTSVKEKY